MTFTSASSDIYVWNPVTIQSSVGTVVQQGMVEEKINNRKVIHPRLYFKFVKSKLSKLEQRELNERLLKLQQLVVQAKDLGQKALYEEFSRKIAICVREQELSVCGIEYFIDREVVEKYRHRIKDVEIGFSKLENFDRPLPTNVKKRVERVQKLKLFDELWVLYLNYKDKTDVGGKKKQEVVKTNKEKIKEKDPILFGIQSYMPDKLYFVVDWIDEYCDLTLDKFVQTIKKDDSEYELDTLEHIDEELIQKLVKESRERHLRLKNTNRGNFKKLMEEEDKVGGKKSIKQLAEQYVRKTLPKKVVERSDKLKKEVSKLNERMKKWLNRQ
jgi:hypothetical protein